MKSVYVGNLPYATTDDELKALFEPFGTVLSAKIKTDRDTGRPLGYGFVQMEDADAAKAIQALDGKEHAGRNLRVNESREKNSSGDRPPRRDSNDRSARPSGNHPPRRDSNDRSARSFGNRPPRRDFNSGRPFGDRPPRRNFTAGFVPGSSSDEFDNESEEDIPDYSPDSRDFGGSEHDRQQRRRTFRKNNQYDRDNRDGDRPRRPFFKSAPRKKGYRPNEDYESEE